ncbi:hypothetical protein JEZ13_10795 [bacterium]|nr:hypothetical protein [bacterium]
MQDNLAYDKSIKRIISRIIRTIRKYKLIEENETIAVALSGGKDSATLLFLLWYINKYSYLKFNLIGLHVQTGDYDLSPITKLCEMFEIESVILHIDMEQVINYPHICYSCARIKRQAMWEEINRRGIRKIAYGHHADDAVDTFFMNLVIHQNIESFPPILHYRKLDLAVIRPIIFVNESWILNLFQKKNLTKISYQCPYEETNIREDFRSKVEKIQEIFPEYRLEENVIKALEKYYDLILADELDDSIKVFK